MGSIGLILLWVVYYHHYSSHNRLVTWIPNMEFVGFNNETGVDHFIIPNIVHQINHQIQLLVGDYESVLKSVLKHNRPGL